MASMRDWLKVSDPIKAQRIIVVHCKAGKGRSGTVACSYLISEEGWTVEDALTRFTARRMRSGFGSGVSIPSQLRWVGYVDWWTKHGKVYVDKQIEILEVHVWGLRDGVKVAIEGYVEEGKVIKTFHTFGRDEKTVMDSASSNKPIIIKFAEEIDEKPLDLHESKVARSLRVDSDKSITPDSGTTAVIFRPAQQIILPTSDVNIDFERRNKARYGFTMVTSVAHVWFNAYFEAHYSMSSNAADPPISKSPPESGVFEIAWEAMDGIKGSARKGTRALDQLAVVWRAVPSPHNANVITEPSVGEPVPEAKPADWTKAHQESPPSLGKDLGLRTESPSSANISRANSMTGSPRSEETNPEAGIRSNVPDGESELVQSPNSDNPAISVSEPGSLNDASPSMGGDGPAVDLKMEKVRSPSPSSEMVQDVGMGKVAGIVDSMKALKTEDLKTAEEHIPGQILKDNEPLSS